MLVATKNIYVYRFSNKNRIQDRIRIYFFISKLITNTIFPIHWVSAREIIESNKSHPKYKSGYLFYTSKKREFFICYHVCP